MQSINYHNKRQVGGKLGFFRRPRGEGGFTLIEMLVAAGLAGFMAAGLWSMFKSNRMALALVDDLRNMEQNARVGVDFMARDLRKAGMGGQQNTPFTPYDNADAIAWANANSKLSSGGYPPLPGTDIMEIFWGFLAQPICLDVGGGIPGFNINNANVKVPRMGLIGLPGYDLSMSGQDLGDLLNQFSVLVYDPNCPTAVNCQKNLTGGGWSSAGGILSSNLNYNNGQNTDEPNHPHNCSATGSVAGFDTPKGSISPDPKPNGCPSEVACINIGEDVYYFIQNVEAGNPQLTRKKSGFAPEVISNYAEDFQMLFGVDGVAATDAQDGMVGSSEWINGLTYNTNVSGPRTFMSRVYLLTKSMKADGALMANNLKQNPPKIDNSTIAQPANGGDFYRRRLVTRTVRMRAKL